MRQRLQSGFAVLTAGILLLAGCKGTPVAGPSVTSPELGNSKPASAQLRAVADQAAVDKAAEAHAHYALGVIHDVDDEPAEAVAEYAKAEQQDPEDGALALDLARRYLEGGGDQAAVQGRQARIANGGFNIETPRQPDEHAALEVLKRATAAPGASGALFALLGQIYANLGTNDLAIEAGKTAIKRSPRDLGGYATLFIVYSKEAKSHPEALKTLALAAKQPGANSDFLCGVGELYVSYARQYPSQKDAVTNAALEVLKRAEKSDPKDPQDQIRLADNFNFLGDSAAATRIYLQVLNEFPDSPALTDTIHDQLAKIYLRDNNTGKAMEQIEGIIKNNPANAQAYFYLGTLAAEDKKPEKAVECYEKTVMLSPNYAPAYYALAEAQINMEHGSLALGTLQKARERFPASYESEFLSGLAYYLEKDFGQAIAHLTSAESLAKTSDESERLDEYFYFRLGAAYEQKGDLDLSEQAFKKSLAIKPDFAESLNYLGYMWADKGVNLEKASEMIQKAVRLEPKNSAYLDSLAWVFYKLNRPQEALPNQLKAIELASPTDPTLYDHLGDIYIALKDNSKAREAYEKSISIQPNDQVKKKLDSLK